MNPVRGLDRDGALAGLDLGPQLTPGLAVRVPVDVGVGAGSRIFRLVRRKDPGVAARCRVDVKMEADIILNNMVTVISMDDL